VYQM